MSNIEDTKPIDVLAARVWSGTHWHYPNIEKMIERIHTLTRDLAAAREELAAITEHVITSIYGFAPVDSGSQLSGAVKSICDERDALREQLAAANATIAACKAAGFIDAEGRVRKVLGELPLTADGAIIGDGATVWGFYDDGTPGWSEIAKVTAGTDDWDEVPGGLYSTPAAAKEAQ